MNYHLIESSSLSNGTGWRVILWVSGCSHRCNNCQNKETWDPKSGKPFTEKEHDIIFDLLDRDYIQGLTFSGGDPLFESNIDEVTKLAKEAKHKYPEKDIWLYTGAEYEQIKDLEILDYTDVLIDGEYVDKLRDITLAFRGSTNQRIIDVRRTRLYNDVVLLNI